MNKNEIIASLNDIFIDALDNEDIKLTEETTANDIEEWDSLSHIQLIVAIEKKFKIRFSSSEIHGFKNIGDMSNAIATKLG